MVVEGRGSASKGVYGSDFVLSLWKTAPAGTTKGSPISLGSFSRSKLQPGLSQWITVTLATPYQQALGEMLAFTIAEATSGTAGYNTYGNLLTGPTLAGKCSSALRPGNRLPLQVEILPLRL